jgi:hypothetical protein
MKKVMQKNQLRFTSAYFIVQRSKEKLMSSIWSNTKITSQPEAMPSYSQPI